MAARHRLEVAFCPGVEVQDLPKHAPNPGVSHIPQDRRAMGCLLTEENEQCTCERTSRISRCQTGHPIRRCPAAGVRRLRHAPCARPTSVQHCVVTFRPGRDGRPALGTLFRLTTSVRGFSRAGSHARDASTGDEMLDCIANSVAAARPVTVIPPIYDMLRQPRPVDPMLAFVAYYLCASFYAIFAEWKERFACEVPRAARE